MPVKKTNRIGDNIQKYSPQWMNKYHLWVKKGKPKEFTVYLLHDKNLKVKKILWRIQYDFRTFFRRR